MNKSDLVAVVAEKWELQKRDAEVSLNAVVEAITDSFSKRRKIQLVGFGSFEVRKRAARKGRNPQTKRRNKNTSIKSTSIQSWKSFQRCSK